MRKHALRHYFYDLPTHRIAIVMGYILLGSIIAIQCWHARSLEKQIMDLNRQLIHIQSCQEAMESVKKIESWGKENREKEIYNIKRSNSRTGI